MSHLEGRCRVPFFPLDCFLWTSNARVSKVVFGPKCRLLDHAACIPWRRSCQRDVKLVYFSSRSASYFESFSHLVFICVLFSYLFFKTACCFLLFFCLLLTSILKSHHPILDRRTRRIQCRSAETMAPSRWMQCGTATPR